MVRNGQYGGGNPGVVREDLYVKPLVEALSDNDVPPRNEKVGTRIALAYRAALPAQFDPPADARHISAN
jgi:hypothetical protein